LSKAWARLELVIWGDVELNFPVGRLNLLVTAHLVIESVHLTLVSLLAAFAVVIRNFILVYGMPKLLSQMISSCVLLCSPFSILLSRWGLLVLPIDISRVDLVLVLFEGQAAIKLTL
jgi:hypothetical protein